MSEISEKYKNIKQRDEYIKSIEKFIDDSKIKADNNRKVKTADKENLRKQYIDTLGYPLNCYEKFKQEEMVKTEPLETDENNEDSENMTITRYQLEVMPGFWFSGILYEPKERSEDKEDKNERNALVIAQHGGAGTSEIVGSLVLDSANYNHMVKRVIRKGITVFAPQLLLWAPEIYGNEGYNRVNIDQKLKQLGGSITALEIFCIMRSIDYFAGLDCIDDSRIGMVGLSYGGMYTLYTAAADVRIKVALSSCWFGERLDHVRTDWFYFNQYNAFVDEEVGSLILPRKLYVEIGKSDGAFPPEKAEPYLTGLTEYAKIEGCADSLKIKVFDGGHELDKADDGIKFFIENL